MDRQHALEIFVAVADTGSFAAAARQLRISPPAVTRAVAFLEDRIGVSLFNRTTRTVTITEPGRIYLQTVRRTLQDLEEAGKAAAGETAVARGHLTITAPVTFGRLHLAPLLAAFMREHRQVTATLLLLDRVTHLVEEGIDIAARIASLPDSATIVRRVGEVRRVLVASPDYLARVGAPTHPDDLKRHDMVSFTGLLPNREWRFASEGRSLSVAIEPRLTINDAVSAIDLAEQGGGITLALSYMVAARLRQGTLRRVLEPFEPPPVPVQLCYPDTRIVPTRLRAFIDYAAPRLQQRLEDLR